MEQEGAGGAAPSPPVAPVAEGLLTHRWLIQGEGMLCLGGAGSSHTRLLHPPRGYP